MTERRGFYPEIEPYDTLMLPVGDGHEIYVEQCGNPEGKPVVFVHGGPGSGVSPTQRRVFDPERYRIVLFDQRMAGRSTPHASTTTDPAVWSTNTTAHLVADMERIREHLGIERWQVFGGSWGSCLSLAYAEAHPDRVTELVLRGIFTLRRHELEWMYERGHLEFVYPDLWAEFVAPVAPERRHEMQVAYHDLLFDEDPAVHVPAGQAWSGWESRVITVLPDEEGFRKATEPAQAVAFARIENHYFVHGGFMREGQLLAPEAIARIRHIPTVIVQGRLDMCTPARTAFDLARALPEAEFVLVPDAGHAFSEPGTLDALVRATDAFAG
ncbi:prolyl aminopeptidase [Ornithinimicrobium tianjinense]|uniref:Proline iminopeptidase n=1 Tax=Ornithinimicrobium tianjinense TaxID=1195761 RepID=A0A917F0Z4_9MICO|nr:prolyl aminopeptidase [Ornithinimicrobium tianjinense]GGF41477.1 proline iminopeptidase [Ornithinimicrobium tianjinense]